MKRWLIGAAGVLLVAVAAAATYSLKSTEKIPEAVKSQISSTIIIPSDNSVEIDRKSYKINDSESLLTYTARFDDQNLIISQQPTPEGFIDIPKAYDSLVSQMGEYGKFESANGTVYLTSPKNQKNIQIAVLNTKGTLMFVKSEQGMSRDRWQKFFSTLEVVK